MHITSSDPPNKFIEQYDITLNSGLVIPLTIDAAVGDTIEFTPEKILVKLAAKPSLIDPSISLPAEDVEVARTQVAALLHRTVEVSGIVPKMSKEWIQSLTKESPIN